MKGTSITRVATLVNGKPIHSIMITVFNREGLVPLKR